MSETTRLREGSAEMQEAIEDVPGTKKWGTREPQTSLPQDEHPAPRPEDVQPPSREEKEEFYESAERAKAKLAQAVGATPEGASAEPDADAPPEQQEAQRRVAEEFKSQS